MKNILAILSVMILTAFLVISCGQTNTNQKELELKERELAIKERELSLKEKEFSVKNSLEKEKSSPSTTKNVSIDNPTNKSVVKSNDQATLSEIYQSNKKIFSDNTETIFTDVRLLKRMKKLMGNGNFNDFKTMNLWGLKNDEVNSNYFFTYYNSCPRACGTYGVIYGDITNNNLIVGFMNLNIKWFMEDNSKPLPQKLKNWLNAAEKGTLD